MINKVDINDLLYVKERGHKPVEWIAGAIDSETGKINPHVSKFSLGNDRYISVFHVKPIYYETYDGAWRPMSEICSHHGNRHIELNTEWRLAHPRFIDWLTKRQAIFGQKLLLPTPFGFIPSKYQDTVRPTLNVGLTTTTVYPDPHPETTTVDGRLVYYTGGAGNWDTIMDASSTNYALPSEATFGDWSLQYMPSGASGWRVIAAVVTTFDTSSIGTDTIDSAVVSIYGGTDTSSPQGGITSAERRYAFGFMSANPGANLVTSDWANLIHTIYSNEIDGTGWSTSSYNDFTLTSGGEALINKTGVSPLYSSSAYVVEDIEPAGSWASSRYGFGNHFKLAETSGTSTDPKLVIEHSAGGGATANNSARRQHFMMM